MNSYIFVRLPIHCFCQIVGQASLKATEGLHVFNALMLAERAFEGVPDSILICIPRNEFNHSQS